MDVLGFSSMLEHHVTIYIYIYICMGALMVTFSKTQNNVTTAAFAAWSLQCHYGVTAMSLQRHHNVTTNRSKSREMQPKQG